MRRIRTILFVLFSCLAFVLESQAGQEPKFTKFNVPHVGRGAGQGTIPIGIVNGDWIMGPTLIGRACLTASCALLMALTCPLLSFT